MCLGCGLSVMYSLGPKVLGNFKRTQVAAQNLVGPKLLGTKMKYMYLLKRIDPKLIDNKKEKLYTK